MTLTLTPKVLLDMDLVAVDYAAKNSKSGEEQKAEMDAYSSGDNILQKPKRPPTSFHPLNPIGMLRWLIYKYKYKVYCCCFCTILIALLLLFVKFYLLK